MVANHVNKKKMACKRRVLAICALLLSLPALAATLPGLFRLISLAIFRSFLRVCHDN